MSLLWFDSLCFFYYSYLNLFIAPTLFLVGLFVSYNKIATIYNEYFNAILISFFNYLLLLCYVLLLLSLYLQITPNFGFLADLNTSYISQWILMLMPFSAFHISSFSLPFLILLHFITLITILVFKSANSGLSLKIAVNRKMALNELLFGTLLLCLHIVLFCFFTSTNFVTFYVTFEASMIPLFLLIFFFGKRKERITAAYYLFFYTLFSSILFLIGISFIISSEGTSSFISLNMYTFSESVQVYGFIAFFLAFAVKLPMLPFHIWLPEAHVEASTEGSVLLAALLLKISAYGIITILFQFFPFGCLYFKPWVISLGLISLIYICLSIYRQLDLKKIIAYTSIAHMNLALLGFFTFTVEGFYGAYSLMIVHGFISSGLFILVGLLYIRFHTRALFYYGGLNSIVPIWSFMFFLFTLANCSFPFTAAFLPEMLIYISLFDNYVWIGFLSLLSALFLVIASLLTYVRLTTGVPSKNVLVSIAKRSDIKNQKSMKETGISLVLDLTSVEFEIIFGLGLVVIFLFFFPSILFQIPLIKILMALMPLYGA